MLWSVSARLVEMTNGRRMRVLVENIRKYFFYQIIIEEKEEENGGSEKSFGLLARDQILSRDDGKKERT